MPTRLTRRLPVAAEMSHSGLKKRLSSRLSTTVFVLSTILNSVAKKGTVDRHTTGAHSPLLWSLHGSRISPPTLCSVVDTFNRSCSCVNSDFDVSKILRGTVERTNASEAGGEDGPKYIVATQAQADEWLENRSIIEFHKARTHLPFKVQEMLSDRPSITVGVYNGLVYAFTNTDDELSKPEHEGLLGHLQYKLADRVIESNHEWQENRTEYSSIFADSIVIAEDSGSYSVYRIDDATCGALLKGHCRGISELNQHTLASITRHHVAEPESLAGTAQSKRKSDFSKHPFSRVRGHFHSREKEPR